MKFELKSKYKPKGDQPKAISELIAGIKAGEKNQTLLGVTGSGKTFTMANVIAKIQKPTLIISHNKTLAAQLAEEFKNFFPKNAVHYFVSYYDYYQPEAYIPRTDTYIEKETSINEEIDRLRNAATHALLTRKDVVIVASVSCIYGLGNPENYRNAVLALEIGKKFVRKKLLEQLVNMQYIRTQQDILRNQFRLRGDLLEIYPSYAQSILKIVFWDEEIEKITEVDPITSEVLNTYENYVVHPAKHFVLPQTIFPPILEAIRQDLKSQVQKLKKQNKLLEAQRLEQRTNFDLEMIQETGYCNGIENYSRYFDNRKSGEPPYTLLDYFPKDYLLILDESHMTIPQIHGMFAGDESRKKTLVEFGFRLPSALDNRPLKFFEFEKRTFQRLFSSATPGPYELKKSSKIVEQIVRPTGLLDPEIEVRPTTNQIDDLILEIKKRGAKKQRVLVTTLTKATAEDLTSYLKEIGMKVAYLHHEVNTLERVEILQDLRSGIYDVVVGINLLREGLDLPEVSLVAILDADKEGFLRSDWSLIQVMGRAARHVEGKAIMYADGETQSMKKAIRETERRRKIQINYNQKHRITPKSIQKTLPLARVEKKPTVSIKEKLTPKQLSEVIHDLQNQMEIAAKNLEFEQAAILRDQIKALRKISSK